MTSSLNEYTKALRLGRAEKKERTDAGLDPYPAVLEEILPELARCSIQDLPVQDIPAGRIIGTVSAGRVSAFSAGFLPLLDAETEFAHKWISLYDAHMSDTGIREPVLCYEYLGDFYVQEGNKRVSVLKYSGSPRIPAVIRRILPLPSDEPRIRAYTEFLEFYRHTKLYDIQYRKPGDYARLLAFLKKDQDEDWSEAERRSFSARFHYFLDAFTGLEGKATDLLPEEALLLWLKVYPYEQLSSMSAKELKASLAGLWGDVVAETGSDAPSLRTEPETASRSVLEKIISPSPSHLNIAFIYRGDAASSPWTRAHRLGADKMQEALGDAVNVRHYDHADSPLLADEKLEEAVADGAELIFTTTPIFLRSCLKAAVKYPKLHFLNCSVDTPLSSVRSYYCRTYEGKFITGLIAGAMAEDDLIGYVGSYPILGVPASICAFAIGARMTNPRAKILLDWSCLPGNAAERLIARGVKILSNRDIPVKEPGSFSGGEYGVYLLNGGALSPLASPVWVWDRLYEHIVRSILSGSWNQKKGEAVNYWWGMSSGAIDVELTGLVPEGTAQLAMHMMKVLREGSFDPFRTLIYAQDGSLKNDGSQGFSPLELLRMDWLPASVVGRIPAFNELLPVSRSLVRELGIYRDSIPPEASLYNE